MAVSDAVVRLTALVNRGRGVSVGAPDAVHQVSEDCDAIESVLAELVRLQGLEREVRIIHDLLDPTLTIVPPLEGKP